ncbi:hypothetical protein [Streptomyces sp. SYSU K21746]
MITDNCRCGGVITFTPARPGEEPKNVRHFDAQAQPAPCPLK